MVRGVRLQGAGAHLPGDDEGRRAVELQQARQRVVKVVKPGPEHGTARGVVGGSEVSAETVGARGLFMGVFRVPPGGRSRPHFHAGCESACYMLSGQMRISWGER